MSAYFNSIAISALALAGVLFVGLIAVRNEGPSRQRALVVGVIGLLLYGVVTGLISRFAVAPFSQQLHSSLGETGLTAVLVVVSLVYVAALLAVVGRDFRARTGLLRLPALRDIPIIFGIAAFIVVFHIALAVVGKFAIVMSLPVFSPISFAVAMPLGAFAINWAFLKPAMNPDPHTGTPWMTICLVVVSAIAPMLIAIAFGRYLANSSDVTVNVVYFASLSVTLLALGWLRGRVNSVWSVVGSAAISGAAIWGLVYSGLALIFSGR